MGRTANTHNPGMLRTLAAWSMGAALALVVLAALIANGCSKPGSDSGSAGGGPPPVDTPSMRDPLAMAATIDDSGMVQPGTVNLSKKAGDRVQWHNDSSDTMMIILKDSHICELIPPRQFSASHRVCLDCEKGFYPYVIKRMVAGVPTNPKGPPGEPQVGVGD